MGKHKKKHSKKDDAADDLLDAVALSIRKFRKVTDEIGKLSPGQKLVGGLALLAGGLVYLNQLKGEGADSPALPFNLRLSKLAGPPTSPEEEGSAEEVPSPLKAHKSTKPGKRPGGPAKKPAVRAADR